jgi:hypothetical protein
VAKVWSWLGSENVKDILYLVNTEKFRLVKLSIFVKDGVAFS